MCQNPLDGSFGKGVFTGLKFFLETPFEKLGNTPDFLHEVELNYEGGHGLLVFSGLLTLHRGVVLYRISPVAGV